MANTMTLIASSTVGAGGAANITFSSIPSTYTDLALYVSARCARSTEATAMNVQLNSDTSSNYNMKIIFGAGSYIDNFSYSSRTDLVAGYLTGANATSNTFANNLIYIPNYAGSTQKSLSCDYTTENNATFAIAGFTAGLWTGTSAITSIKIFEGGGSTNLVQYSSAYLYGVKNA